MSSQIQDKLDKIKVCVCQCTDELDLIKTDQSSFTEDISTVKSDITSRYKRLQKQLESHYNELINKLESIEKDRLNMFRLRKEMVQQQLVELNGFQKQCDGMGLSESDESNKVSDLIGQADRLLKRQDEQNKEPLKSVQVSFMDTSSQALSDTVNLVGDINVDEQSFSLRSFAVKSKVVQVLSPGGSVGGIAVHENELFIARYNKAQIEVYDMTSFKSTRQVKVSELFNPEDLLASSTEACLYISEPSFRYVHRVDLKSQQNTKWSVNDAWNRLSLARNGNILLTISIPQNKSRIQEYTPQGKFVKSISLDGSIDSPAQSIQLSSSHFVVCHRGTTYHRVCLIDSQGTIVQTYGGPKGSGAGQMNSPTGMACDRYDNIAVADCKNNRVQLISPSLSYLGDIKMKGYDMVRPITVLFDEEAGRLYIGEDNGGRVFILSIK